ncbi:TrkH family potassium uptake protein [Kocuria palustris]|uniref:TrkH family potassium uptake protein n=1 Tax=Kocuria palustris TaxID=71999 RepID=UPI0021B2AE7A|nr:potassium transporter TrkG [Kocuria palustris]
MRDGIGGLRDLVDRLAQSSPARLAVLVFVAVAALFTVLLWLPWSTHDGRSTSFVDAAFTAASAVTVTGLTVVPTADHWSFTGQLIILVAVQIGGLGTLTMTSILALAIGRKLGLRSKLVTQNAMNVGRLGEVGSLLRTVALTSIVIEGSLAVVLTLGFLIEGEPPHTAAWHGIFYSISAFNNGGFTPHSDGLVPYFTDAAHMWLILFPISLGVLIGSLGFPVILVLRQVGWLRFRRWNLNTKVTVVTTLALLVLGWVLWAGLEWTNPATIGDESPGQKLFNGFFASAMMRSGGFNIVDMSDLQPVTLLLTDALMFAGGAPASTGGGIKVTTFAVVVLAILAEARGDQAVIAFHRTIPDGVLRIAISVIAMGATVVLAAAGVLLIMTGEPLERVLFEVVSAYATCGLSVGLSGEMGPAGKAVLIIVMFIGRIGTTTVATALALRSRRRLYQYPEERLIIG